MKPEFNWYFERDRNRYVILRHGAHYLDIPHEYPTAYVLRVVGMLNGGHRA